VPEYPCRSSVSTSRSSNRTCRSPASGSRTRHTRRCPRKVISRRARQQRGPCCPRCNAHPPSCSQPPIPPGGRPWLLGSKPRVLPSLEHVMPAAAPVPWWSLQGCPNLQHLATFSIGLELRSLGSTGVTRLPRYCGPLRHPTAPSLAVTGLRLVATTDHAIGLPVLRSLSLCTCCRHYPGAATGDTALLIRPVMSAFPDRVFGSACASSFSRLARRSLALRPAHSRCHQFVARFTRRLQPLRYLHDCSGCFRLEHLAGWGFHPQEKRRLCTAHTLCGRSVSRRSNVQRREGPP